VQGKEEERKRVLLRHLFHSFSIKGKRGRGEKKGIG